MSILPLSLVVFGALLCSCAQRTTKNHLEKSPDEPSLVKRLEGGFSYKKDAFGNLTVVSDKRSAFEGDKFDPKGNPLARKEFKTEKFDTKTYEDFDKNFETAAWKGNKSYEQGNLSTPEFITKAKGVSTKTWEDRNKSFETKVAAQQNKSYEGFNKQFQTKKNAFVEEKKNNFERPVIMSSGEHQATTISETRSMLGRED